MDKFEKKCFLKKFLSKLISILKFINFFFLIRSNPFHENQIFQKIIINIIISLFNVIMVKSNTNIFFIYLHYQYYFTIHFKISLNL